MCIHFVSYSKQTETQGQTSKARFVLSNSLMKLIGKSQWDAVKNTRDILRRKKSPI